MHIEQMLETLDLVEAALPSELKLTTSAQIVFSRDGWGILIRIKHVKARANTHSTQCYEHGDTLATAADALIASYPAWVSVLNPKRK